MNKRYLSLTEACFATSYVATTFHPTIGQCAHQSLSNTATPEMGIVPQGIRGNQQAHTYPRIHKTQPSQHSWVYQANTELERLDAKLVSSIQELWKPAPELA